MEDMKHARGTLPLCLLARTPLWRLSGWWTAREVFIGRPKTYQSTTFLYWLVHVFLEEDLRSRLLSIRLLPALGPVLFSPTS